MPRSQENRWRWAQERVSSLGITRVVCLAPPREIANKSPEYAQAIDSGALPWPHDPLPIEDFGAPAEAAAFWRRAYELALFVRGGGRLLVHCAAGIGRTGTFAVAVSMRLGLALTEATRRVRAAGSGPEVPAQESLLAAGPMFNKKVLTSGNAGGAPGIRARFCMLTHPRGRLPLTGFPGPFQPHPWPSLQAR